MISRHLEKGCHVSMGYIHSKICWDLTIPHVEKLVLMALCWFTNEEGECFPSREQLALKTGLGVNHISKITKTLCEKGLLWKGSKGGVNTLYKVLIPDTHPYTTCSNPYTTCSQGEPTPLHDMYTPPTPHVATPTHYVAPPTPHVDKPIYNLQEPTKEPIPPIPPTGADVDFFAGSESELPATEPEPKKTETQKKSDRLDELFQLFYKLYPVKPTGPKNSKRSWKRIVTTETLANQIIDNVRERLVKDIKWVEAIASRDKRYICAPEVFLNQERWLGEYTKVGSIKPVGGNGRYDQNHEPDDGGGIQQFIPPPKDTRTPEEKAAEQRQIDMEREAVKKRMLERNMSKDEIPF